ADIPVEHVLVVVVDRLNHLVASDKAPAEFFNDRFYGPRRIEFILEPLIQFTDAEGTAIHGTKHLYIADGIEFEPGGNAISHHVGERADGFIGLVPVDEEII